VVTVGLAGIDDGLGVADGPGVAGNDVTVDALFLKYLIQYKPVPGREKEMNLSPDDEIPNLKPNSPQLHPIPFFVTLQRNGPER
jgi:hypothetical protein